MSPKSVLFAFTIIFVALTTNSFANFSLTAENNEANQRLIKRPPEKLLLTNFSQNNTAIFGDNPQSFNLISTSFPADAGSLGAIPDTTLNGPAAWAAPRNVTFSVSGTSSPISDISLEITLSHTFIGDLEVVLAPPGCNPGDPCSFLIFARVGATTTTSFGDSSNLSGTYTFRDSAVSNIWFVATNGSCGTGCVVNPQPYRTVISGPTTNPAAVTNFNAWAAAIGNTNGTWTLRFRDGTRGDSGSVTAAALNLTTNTVIQNQTITFDSLPGKTYGDSDFNVSATASSGLPVSFSANGNCTLTGSLVHITAAGSCSITASQPGNANYNPAPDVTRTFNIEKAVLNVTANNQSKQYSDPLPALTYGITGFVNGDTIAVVNGAPVLTTAVTQFDAPGAYPINIVIGASSADNYTFNLNDGELTVTPEDARLDYTGMVFVNTLCPTCGNAVVTLAATVKDITFVPTDSATDPDAGEITNAAVTFINRETMNPITGCENLPVSLVSAENTGIGTVSCNWNVDIGSESIENFTVGIIVNGYYTRDDSADNEIVTVSKPDNSDSITGGGYLILSNSAGQYAGTAGTKSNFGFNVKYNNSGKNLKGRVNVIFRSGERVYQINGKVMFTLTVDKSNPLEPKAVYTGKANLTDITDPYNPISLGGNKTFKVELTDRGEPGNSDSIGITVWNDDGGILFSSNWDGSATVEQNLDGGNLVVH